MNSVVKEIRKNYVNIAINPNSKITQKIRKKVFVDDQHEDVIFLWFNSFKQIQLTPAELNSVKKIISNLSEEEYKEGVIKTVINNQTQLSIEQIIEFVEILDTDKRKNLNMDIIKNKNIINDALKIRLFKELIEDAEYQRDALAVLDDELDEAPFWGKLVEMVIDIINSNNEQSEQLANYWEDIALYLNLYTKKHGLKSSLLYKKTNMEHYLPQEAQDIFFF